MFDTSNSGVQGIGSTALPHPVTRTPCQAMKHQQLHHLECCWWSLSRSVMRIQGNVVLTLSNQLGWGVNSEMKYCVKTTPGSPQHQTASETLLLLIWCKKCIFVTSRQAKDINVRVQTTTDPYAFMDEKSRYLGSLYMNRLSWRRRPLPFRRECEARWVIRQHCHLEAYCSTGWTPAAAQRHLLGMRRHIYYLW